MWRELQQIPPFGRNDKGWGKGVDSAPVVPLGKRLSASLRFEFPVHY